MKTIFYFFPAACLFLLLSFGSCSIFKSGSPQQDISAVEWQLVSVQPENGGAYLIPASGQQATLLVIDGRVSGNTGCNSFSGNAERDKSKISFSGIGATRKFCVSGMDIEAALLKVLNSTDNFKIKDGKLQLRQGSQTLATFSDSANKVWKVE
ncbi:META domain-containing protein [Dysgonomonas sp. GY75]|uniref:META domain-containing protein n=1 Tax=Dysgonomonas sp. GY75 TaxID=2780419 RepID=UPI001883405A|nr:META domain-containing protein [Dysgonomonas sp. GY75]MBF0648578.1 META domain-containing protein [Dysgonomonas sp. GY75]